MNQNLMRLLQQFKQAPNKESFIMSMANPQQKQLINSMKGTSKEEQAQKIADYCNANNINKEQLETMLKVF